MKLSPLIKDQDVFIDAHGHKMKIFSLQMRDMIYIYTKKPTIE